MKERPIMARGCQVRAILEGRQTQMRRVAKYNPFLGEPSEWGDRAKNQEPEFVRIAGDYRRFCPYGQPGDRLWVRERIDLVVRDGEWASSCYPADGSPTVADAWPWKSLHLSPLFCPRGLSRITLELVNVRVERVRDISEADAECEGVELATPQEAAGSSHKSAYRRLWESINGKESWSANPWVWVLDFKRMQP